MSIYLDCNATTPLDGRVAGLVMRYMVEEFGNAGSRTHEHGSRAKQAVERAREQVARVVGADRDQVVFTSGATESNNLAILGLRAEGEHSGRRHVVSTAIEHKAVLEPLERLARAGWEVELVGPGRDGRVAADAVLNRVRDDTLLVSVMAANNESGVVQPVDEIAARLPEAGAFFHVDAAQAFGKECELITHPRIDLLSISGHKIYGPKGVGALVCRRRGFDRVPLEPVMVGGGQERGLRPGTLPVPLIAGLGLAAELAVTENDDRRQRCIEHREAALAALMVLDPVINGDPAFSQPHVLNLSFPGLDAEAAMVALKRIASVSNGSACTSASYRPSHVLQAMGLDEAVIEGAIRISWCHMTPEVDWAAIVTALGHIR